MTCTPFQLLADGTTTFPTRAPHTAGTPIDIPIQGCGLMNLNPSGGKATISYQQWGYVDTNLLWHSSGWGLFDTDEVKYAGCDDTHMLGVTYYPSHGRILDGNGITTPYYNPNAYWTPPDPTDPGAPLPGDPAYDPPTGADPGASAGQDPGTLNPPPVRFKPGKPYKYAVMKMYDQMGLNRTGLDLEEDPDHPGTFLDPYDPDVPVLRFIYDDQDPEHSNLANFDWEPDGEATANQAVRLVASAKAHVRGIRKIARNIHSWHEIGVYSSWDAINGSNTEDASPDNIEGNARAEVERYGRPPNQFKLYLRLEPASGTPDRGTGVDPAPGWQPQPFRDFAHGDRIIARGRKGYMDTGEIVGRIMSMKVSQADANNNVTVELDCVPHSGDASEIGVV